MSRILKDEGSNFLKSKSNDLLSVVTDDSGVIKSLPFSLLVEGTDVSFVTSSLPDDVEFLHLEFNGFIGGTYTSHRIKFNATGNGYIGTTTEVYGPFVSDPYDEVNLALEFTDESIAPVLYTTVSPVPPGAVNITAATGTVDEGDIVISIAELPDGGDGDEYQDGLGTVDFIDIQINEDGWVELTDAPATGDFTYTTPYPGQTLNVAARARSAYRAGPAGNSVSVVAKDVDVEPVFPVDLGLMTPLSLNEGEAWSVDLDDYISGATRFVINTNLTGASYNSTTHVYSVASLATENVTLNITAYNGAADTDPNITVLWDIEVVPTVVVPTLVAGGIPDVALQVGETISVNLASYFTGSGFTISLDPNDDATFGLGTDSEATYFKNKVELNSEYASTSFTVTATNSAGSASDTFSVQVALERAPALVVDTDVKVKYAVNRFGSVYRAAVIEFPTDKDVITGKTVEPIWTTATPNIEGVVPPNLYEFLEKTSDDPKEYQTQMDEVLARGDPDTQTIDVTLGTDPFATVSGSPNITITTPTDHGFFLGRLTRYSGQVSANGVTISSSAYYPVTEIVDSTHFKITVSTNATSTGNFGGSSAVLKPQRADYSVFGVEENRANNVRVALKINGVESYWSDVLSVPQVVDPDPDDPDDPVILTDRWIYNSRRPYGSYYNESGTAFVPRTDPYVGSEGKQFEHCVARNANRYPSVEDRDLVVVGQDENTVTLSDDFGRIFIPSLNFGLMSAASTGGLYLETDCFSTKTDIVLAIGGYAWYTGVAGMYISEDLCKKWDRIKLVDNGVVAWNKHAMFTRTNQNWLNRRPQTIVGTPLTDLQRPWYALELTNGGGNTGGLTRIKLWRNKNPTTTAQLKNANNWEVIQSWPVTGANSPISSSGTTMSSPPEAWLGVKVATNGDVAVYGTKGIEISTNAGTADAADVTFTRVFNGWVTGLEFDLTLNSSTVSGAYCCVYYQGGTTGWGVYKTSNARTSGGWNKPSNHGIHANAGCNTLSVSPVDFDYVYVSTINKRNAEGGSKVYFSSTGGVGSSSENTGFKEVSVITPQGYTDNNHAFKYKWGDRPSGAYTHFTNKNQALGAMQGGAFTVALNNTSFNGKICGFMDHSHDKGWGYDPTDVDRYGVMQQDGGACVNIKGERYTEYPGIRHNMTVVNQNGVSKTAYAFCQDVAGGNAGRTSGKVIFPVPGHATRWIACLAPDAFHNKNVPLIFDINSKGDDYTGTPVIRTDVGWTRGAKFFIHPNFSTGTETVIAGKWFISNYNAANPKDINFTSYNDYEVLGWSKEGTSINWLFGTAGNSGSTIYRSTNANGSNPTTWKGLSSSTEKTACAVNPFQHQMLFYSSENDDGLLKRITASSNQTIVNFRPLIDAQFVAKGITQVDAVKANINFVLADLNVEGLLYICFNCQGLAGVWRVRNAHASNLDDLIVEDITLNSTYTNSAMISVHPMTGELRFSSSMGQYILPAPDWYPNLTYKNRHVNFLSGFYGKNGIPTPRVVTPL